MLSHLKNEKLKWRREVKRGGDGNSREVQEPSNQFDASEELQRIAFSIIIIFLDHPPQILSLVLWVKCLTHKLQSHKWIVSVIPIKIGTIMKMKCYQQVKLIRSRCKVALKNALRKAIRVLSRNAPYLMR